MIESLTIIIVIIGITFVFLSYYLDDKNQNDLNKTIEDYEEYQSRLTEVNGKIFEINEYSEFIKSEIDEKHRELLFLYQLVNEKYKEVEGKASNGEVEELLDNHPEISRSQMDKNKKILHLSEEGVAIKDIAKELNIGQGEVRLVINLFK